MTYNLHPLFVHFPIALLFLYSVIKILPMRRMFPRVAWRDIEVTLLVVGILGALGAYFTGGIAEKLVVPDKKIVEMHSTFAFISLCIYGLTLFIEFFFVHKVHTIVLKLLALLGLVAITVTGMLGGVMVYGLSADPMAPIVLHLLGLK